MDKNHLRLQGTVAAPPEVRRFDSGSVKLRLLLMVKTNSPRRRIDVLPLTLWQPPTALLEKPLEVGERVTAKAQVQRRFWTAPTGKASRVEIVADCLERELPD